VRGLRVDIGLQLSWVNHLHRAQPLPGSPR